MYSAEQIKSLRDSADRHGITPANCPSCKYDRKFPETKRGGWMYMGNNGPYVACPMCNADERQPRG